MIYQKPWFEVEAGHGGAIAMMMVPEELAEQIVEWSDSHIDDGEIYGKDGKGRDRSPHVTVQNGIMCNDSSELEKLFSGVGPIDMKLGPLEVFSDADKEYDVVHIPVISDQLQDLNGMIGELLEVNNPHPEYKPHITLSYVKKGRGSRFRGLKDFDGAKTTLYDAVIDGKGVEPKKFSLNKQDDSTVRGPLMESVDYPASLLMFAAQDVEDLLRSNGKSIKDFKLEEVKNMIIELRKPL